MNTLTKEIEKENNIPHFFGENSSNNLFYDNTEFNESFYYNLLDELNVSNRDARLDDENKEINPQTNTEGKKTKDKYTDIKSNHIEKEKNENKFLGRKLSKHDSKNYSKNSESQKNEVNDEKNQSKKEEIILPKYKLENYIKAFKANMLGYINITLGNLYKNCQFDKFDNEFRNMTFHVPNYKKYQGNAKQKDNKEFIKKQIKEVFQDYDVNEIEGTGRQKDNKSLIKKIYEIISFPSTAEQKALKDFLEMTIEKAIEKYYDFSEFQEFIKSEKIIFFDSNFSKQKFRNYSMLDKNNGFLRWVSEPYYFHNPK